MVCAVGVWGIWVLYESADQARRSRVAQAQAEVSPDGSDDYELAIRLLEGRGVAKDPDRAVSLLERAAGNGYVPAQYQLGMCLREGIGIPRNEQRAITWLRLAAEAGEPRAEYELGMMYVHGNGAPRDVVNGYAWLSLASAHGIRAAEDARKGVLSQMNATQVRTAEAAAQRLVATRGRAN